MSKDELVRVLSGTLNSFERGYYVYRGEMIPVKLTPEQIYDAEVFLPEDLETLEERPFSGAVLNTSCVKRTENIDSWLMAQKLMDEDRNKKVLVLNLANPVHPGGGVRRGAKAQEEDLCRRSSLLINLEGRKAAPYYEYNNSLRTYMGSHAVIISDTVEVIKDEKYNAMKDSYIVSVLTCAAPMVTYGYEGMSRDEYYDMLKKRIEGILKAAAYKGYTRLVLGAFGCGAFSNDAIVVSQAFADVFESFRFHGMNLDELFESIDFAVLCTRDPYNLNAFSAHFHD